MKNIQDNSISDKSIRSKCGTRDPFRVPEGYFEGLTAQVMASLPPKEAVKSVPLARRASVRWMAAASVACLVALGGYVTHRMQDIQEQESAQVAYGDEEIDEALDYVMMTNADIATYLTMGE